MQKKQESIEYLMEKRIVITKKVGRTTRIRPTFFVMIWILTSSE